MAVVLECLSGSQLCGWEDEAGGRTFQAEGTACTKVRSMRRMGPRDVTFNAFKILHIPPAWENIS